MKRLTRAIMFSDIVDFSEKMGEDEDLTLGLVEEHNQVIVPLVQEHQGQVIKFLGDGVMSCFESATDAVRCGIAIQKELRERNQKIDDERKKIVIRIGIHIGDVVLKEGDAFGEGVNVASRIEPLAEPGGICISQTVYDMVRAQPTFQTLSLGQQELRHIKQMIHVYKVILEAEGVDLEPEVLEPPSPPPKAKPEPKPGKAGTPLLSLEEARGRPWTIPAAIVAVLLVIALVVVFLTVDLSDWWPDTASDRRVVEQTAAVERESGTETAAEQEPTVADEQTVTTGAPQAAAPISEEESAEAVTPEPPPEPPAPTTGELRVTTELDGVTVFVDGQEVDADFLTLDADEWVTVRVEKEGYVSFEQDVLITAGELTELPVALVPVPKAILTVETEPADARVRILNIEAPYQAGIDLPPGRYQIQVSAEGHETWTEWMDLDVGDSYKRISLEPFGTLVVTTHPSHARVRVREIGADGMLEWMPYEPGLPHKPASYYEIEVQADGYVPQRVYTSKSRAPVTVNLEPDEFTSELYARRDDGAALYEFMVDNADTLVQRDDFDELWRLFLDSARTLLERDIAFAHAAEGPVADHHGHYVDDPRSCEDLGEGGWSVLREDASTIEKTLTALMSGNVTFWSKDGPAGGAEQGEFHAQRLMGERFDYTIKDVVNTSKTFTTEGEFEGIDVITTRGTRFFIYNDGFADQLWAYSCADDACTGSSFTRCP